MVAEEYRPYSAPPQKMSVEFVNQNSHPASPLLLELCGKGQPFARFVRETTFFLYSSRNWSLVEMQSRFSETAQQKKGRVLEPVVV